jgi:hypothetical protein
MWKPIIIDKLEAVIEESELDMSKGCLRFWEYIKINPEKWNLSPEGDVGGGFWVVAVIGKTCIYYNDIEDGFNVSSYETFGRIDNYNCNQSDLLTSVDGLYNWICQSN